MTDTTAGEGVLTERLAKAFAERDGFTWSNERVLMTGRGGSRTRLTFVRQAEEHLAVVEKAGLSLAAQPSAGAQNPSINIVCEATSNGITGQTSLPVTRVEVEDDGSFTAFTDYWPATPAQPDTGDVARLHHSTAFLVDRFAAALKEKLAKAEAKYGYRDGWRDHDWHSDLVAKLVEHVQKGDPRDVAAYCAFAWHHGWSITPPDTGDVAALWEALEASLAALQRLHTDVEALMADSEGVYGLHGNGDPAPWDELREGGQFEDWIGTPLWTARNAWHDGQAALSKPNAPGRGS